MGRCIIGNTVYDDIKDTQSKVNKDIEKLEEMKRTLVMYRNLCKMCDVTDPLWFTPDGSVK